ncbi:mobilization protein [Lentzea sp. NBRC 102530]|nr:mobilization protein [Lentzea sp. NBRC 102530]
MIAKAPAKGKYGADTYGLLRYLFGPGKRNEHTNPHLVASWDPEWLSGGAFAHRHRGWMARLAREIDAPMTGHNVTLPGGHVYHVALSIPRQDGELGDGRWRELAEDAVARLGFSPDGEGRAGCRWVAVHHGLSKDGNDHIHLAVNLVRGDGTVADTYRDWPRWRQWCLDVEQRLGLTPTSPANKTAAVRPSRAEVEKAVRGPQPRPSRDFLRLVVRAAAAEAATAAEFVELLEREPLVSVHARWDSENRLTGYRVALFADLSASSEDGRVWFGGSRLAHDLSAPKLMHRWASIRGPADLNDTTGLSRNAHVLDMAAEATHSARRHMKTLVEAEDTSAGSGGDDIAHAAADMVIAVSKAVDGPVSGPLSDAVAAYEWVAVAPHRVQPVRWKGVAIELRQAARSLLKAGVLSRRARTGPGAVALVLALVALVAEIAAWREQAGQLPQAAEARRAAGLLSSHSVAQGQRPSTVQLGSSKMPSLEKAALVRRLNQQPRSGRPAIGGHEQPRGSDRGRAR